MPYTPEKTATITIYGVSPTAPPEEEKPPEKKPTIDWRIIPLLLLGAYIITRKR